jgi:cell division septum initiation protein DivIVA
MAEAPQATGAFVGEREELSRRIEELEADVSRYREKEQLLVNTLVSATSHATAMRESARREAELILRKARAEAQKRKAAVERARGDAERELLRLRRVTEQMRRGLSGFLTEKLEELQLEVEQEMPTAEPNAELETALESAVDARVKRAAPSASDPEGKALGEDERRSTGGSEHGLRFP